MIRITHTEAREYLFKYQHLFCPRQLESDEEILDFVRKVGCIQYDPLNKIARNADLVLQSRCKNYSDEVLYRLLYEKRALLDGWDKNMSIWSVKDWPYFSRKRAGHRTRYRRRAKDFAPVRETILRKIQEHGSVSSKDVSGKHKVDWSWAPTDIGRATLESMYHCGELVIHHKAGARKHYGLTEELVPTSILSRPDPNENSDDYHDWYVKRRIGSIGLLWNKSSDAWLGSGLKKGERSESMRRLLEKGEITGVKIGDIDETFYVLKKDLKLLNSEGAHGDAALIAPLDNLIWDRKLISKLFDFAYKWEVYTPTKERQYGYYVLPITYNARFICRCEPIIDTRRKRLLIQNWWWERGIRHDQKMTDALTRCFTDFARFLNVERIVLADSIDRRKLKWLENCV